MVQVELGAAAEAAKLGIYMDDSAKQGSGVSARGLEEK